MAEGVTAEENSQSIITLKHCHHEKSPFVRILSRIIYPTSLVTIMRKAMKIHHREYQVNLTREKRLLSNSL